MVAYDYEAQRWVDGQAAEKLLAEQQAEDAELLKNPAYLAFIAKKSEPAEEFHDEGCTCIDCCEGMVD